MTKVYKYRGYEFYQTSVINYYRKNGRGVYLYTIEGLKHYGTRPFLTTIASCKEFINNHLNT